MINVIIDKHKHIKKRHFGGMYKMRALDGGILETVDIYTNLVNFP